MTILKLFLLSGLIFFSFGRVEAKGIPYCSKKINTGCVVPKPGQTAKTYKAPTYGKKKIAAKSKIGVKGKIAAKSKKGISSDKKLSSNKIKKNKNPKITKKTKSGKRKIASEANLSPKKKKNKKY